MSRYVSWPMTKTVIGSYYLINGEEHNGQYWKVYIKYVRDMLNKMAECIYHVPRIKRKEKLQNEEDITITID